MDKYEEEFKNEINFYYMNLTMGAKINDKAKKNLERYARYDYERLCNLEGYDEIGLVEFVADDEFTIYNNRIMSLEEYDELNIEGENE